MARSSLPFLNKTGYTMYWDSIWDNKNDFSNFFIKNLFIFDTLPLFYVDNASSKIDNFFPVKTQTNKSSKYEVFVNYDLYFNSYNIFFKKIYNTKSTKFSKKINIYSSKIWFIKYQNWIIIYLFFYISSFNKFSIYNIDNDLNILNLSNNYEVNLILENFYFFKTKLEFDFNFFKRQLFLCSEF